MSEDSTPIRILLVDDDENFRQAIIKKLGKRDFQVTEAISGEEALQLIPIERPRLVLLDLEIPGMGGLKTLRKIREIAEYLPVIILTGHGTFTDAIAGINKEIVDFLQKPVDVELLEARIRAFFRSGKAGTLREKDIAELMVSPAIYPRLYVDQPVSEAVRKLQDAFFQKGTGEIQPPQIRSALVYNRKEKFLGLIRFPDLLKLVFPAFLADSPHTSYFTGMFLAQCKMIVTRSIEDLMGEFISVDFDAPLMLAVQKMVTNHVVTLPVMKNDELVGILREKDIILEIARNLGTLA